MDKFKAGDTVKLSQATTFDKLVMMGIKPDVAEFMIKQCNFNVKSTTPFSVKLDVKKRTVEILNKYIEKVS